MAQPTYRTLGDMRQELRVRLGFAATGSAQGASNDLLNSFLQQAQNSIYWEQDWKFLMTYVDVDLGVNQNQIDYPGAINPQRLVPPVGFKSPVWVKDSSTWIPINEGISADMWDTMDTTSVPSAYERYNQILFYPKNNTLRTVRVWGIVNLGRFTQDADFASINSDLVFLHALAHAKAHYGKSDAAVYLTQFTALMNQLKGKQIGSNGVFSRGQPSDDRYFRPQVIGRDI